MSSTYRLICLNHNPSIVLDPELTYDEAKTLGTRDRFQGHEQCDLVIGRYSYPMVEVACLGRDFLGPTGCKSYHGGIQWTDRSWLRLLLAAAPSIDADLLRPLVSGCWPLDRLERLRVELDLPAAAGGIVSDTPVVGEATPGCGPPPDAVVASVPREELHQAIRLLARLDPKWWRNELGRMALMEGHTSLLGRDPR